MEYESLHDSLLETKIEEHDFSSSIPRLSDEAKKLSDKLSDKPMPFRTPNANTDRELIRYINGNNENNTKVKRYKSLAIGITVIGLPWLLSKVHLVKKGQLGYTLDNGIPFILSEGWHLLLSGFHKFQEFIDLNKYLIKIGPVTIVTIQDGYYGFSLNNGLPEILLPGRHVRNSPLWKYHKQYHLTDPLIEFPPITIIRVNTGQVGIGNQNGHILEMKDNSRYEINSGTFKFKTHVTVQQRVKKFHKVRIATQDGVQMCATGLLTYQLTNPVKLIENMSIKELDTNLEMCTEAALVNLFTKYPLKVLGFTQSDEHPPTKVLHDEQTPGVFDDNKEVRNHICDTVANVVGEISKEWGIQIHRFQLQELLFYDKDFMRNYENVTLELTTTEVKARAADIKNKIKIANADAEREVVEIQAQGIKVSAIKRAEGEARGIEICASARKTAGETMMDNKLAEKLALLDIRRQIVASSQVRSLAIMGNESQASLFLNPALDHTADEL